MAAATNSGYAADPHWRAFERLLPPEWRLDDATLPVEAYWPWRGHQVHLDRFVRPGSPVTLILLHGVGSNGRQMSLIVGAPLARRGIETVALDLPPYGQTRVPRGAGLTYDEDWVRLVQAFVAAERQRQPRPIVLFGLSAGGMLTYHVAALDRRIAGIIGTTFLDQRVQLVRDATAYNQVMSRIGAMLAARLAPTPLGRIRMPMRLAARMHTLVNDPHALRILLADRTAAGNWVSLRFLHSYLTYQPALEPEDFDVCPVLLVQPAADRWTPLDLSEPVLRKIRRVPVRRVLLEGAGHLPIEQPSFTQLADAITAFITDLTGPPAR